MGKFMRKNRSADVPVPAENRGLHRQRKFEEDSAMEEQQQPSKKIQILICSGGGGGIENAGDSAAEIPAAAPDSSNSPHGGIDDAEEEEGSSSSSERGGGGEEEEEELFQGSEFVKSSAAAASKLQLRESHSDSCLRSSSSRGRGCRRPITAHSRSNSACFSQDQVLNLSAAAAGAGMEVEEEDEVHGVDEESPKVSTTKDGEPSSGDNTLVLFNTITKRKRSDSHETHDQVHHHLQQHSSTTVPQGQASSSRRQTSVLDLGERSERRRRDCGPGWRHRAAATATSAPSTDEIEEFFAGVEQGEKDDRRRFLDKYNFDVFNDVPLPGRFEWVHLQQS